MLCRVAVVAIAVAGCGFEPGVAPPTSDSKHADSADVDAPACAALDITAGGDHTCAIATNGRLYCWGRGDDGQIGLDVVDQDCINNTVVCQTTPVLVHTLPEVVSVGAGVAHTCAATSSKTYCWGKNTTSQYGDNSLGASATPKPIEQRPPATAIDGGAGHTCSLANGTIYCSGQNMDGQVGNASFVQQMTAVAVMSNATSLSLGTATSCAIDTSRKLYCWGRNVYKTIDQTMAIKTVPTLVAGGTGVSQVAVGSDHICALFDGGIAKCWGLNASGQLGNGQTSTTAQPMTTVDVANVAEIGANRNHTCVRTTSGEVLCFGETYTPTPTAVVTGATKLAVGSSHECAILGDGTIRCWGDQTYGQLGNKVATATRSQTPQVAALCR